VVLAGDTSPWNTLALWRVDTLARVGFLQVSEGVGQAGVGAGAEEVATIALLQRSICMFALDLFACFWFSSRLSICLHVYLFARLWLSSRPSVCLSAYLCVYLYLRGRRLKRC
jgi:hypothetical protein